MYEFETTYSPNTGNLNAVYTGSGVHLRKDVTFSVSLLDPSAKTINSDSDLVLNPLTNSVSFDILDINGNVKKLNHQSGTTSRSLTLTETQNAEIFGSYQKDFGVRTTVSSSYNGLNKESVSEFYFYGNIPQINTGFSTVYDGGQTKLFTGSGIQSGVIIYENVQQLDQILVNVQLDNSLKFVDVTNYDIYVSTEDDIKLYTSPSLNVATNPYFLYSQVVKNYEDVSSVTIKRMGLEYDRDYYFVVVPYSPFGSGNHFKFGPKRFTGLAPINTDSILETNLFKINNGTESVNFSLLTGVFTGAQTTLDSFPIEEEYTVLYTIQAKRASDNKYYSTRWTVGFFDTSTKNSIRENINGASTIDYGDSISAGNYRLFVNGDSGSSYKIYKTTL
jgi:hypothetical protein